MVQAYNFLASWQLFPEKCNFQHGTVPKSGIYKIESIDNGQRLGISINWVSITNEAYCSQYNVKPDGELHPFDNIELADTVQASIVDSSTIKTIFSKDGKNVLEVTHEILPNGYMKLTQQIWDEAKQETFTNIEVYHKQMSVLPYASSASSVSIRPTQEGMIKHKALFAMEERTNMQLEQIKQQIELLARQAQEITKRKELSMMIYEASLKFKPQIGHTYHLYEKRDGTHVLSLVSPKEWGGSGPHKQFISTVQLLADHTWKEVNN